MTTENKNDTNERNTIYKDEMYNPERKNRFLNQDKFSEGSEKTYKRVFLISRGLEEAWGKDLVDFTLNEIKDLLKGMRPLTRLASKSNVSMVTSYIDWCIENGYRTSQSNINPLQGVRTSKEFINEFVVKDIQLYISKEELDDILDRETGCKNNQDACIFSSLFNGISTRELCQMKKEDIKDGYVLLRDENSELKKDENGDIRKFEVDEQCLRFLLGAAEEKFYNIYTNEDKKQARFESVELIDNEYVLRVGNTNSKNTSQPVKLHVITRRVNVIGEQTNNPYLTPKNIVRSGHIYEGFKLWNEAGRPKLEDGYLTTEMYHAICRKFNMKKVKMGNSMTYNTNILRQYINADSLSSLGYLESH